jgi:hypothetical protein
MPDRAYEMRELQEARRAEQEVDRAPLSERKENMQSFYESMRDEPETVAERIDWVLTGNYGYGQMLVARQATKRTNRPALFTQLVGVYEWRCPRRMAVDAWKKLTKVEQAKLQLAVEAVVAEHDRQVDAGER